MMALRLKVTEDFEQMYDGIVHKFIKGQELVGDGADGGLAAFIGYKQPDKVEIVEGVWINPKVDLDKVLEDEKKIESTLADKAVDLKENKEVIRKEAVKAEKESANRVSKHKNKEK